MCRNKPYINSPVALPIDSAWPPSENLSTNVPDFVACYFASYTAASSVGCVAVGAVAGATAFAAWAVATTAAAAAATDFAASVAIVPAAVTATDFAASVATDPAAAAAATDFAEFAARIAAGVKYLVAGI